MRNLSVLCSLVLCVFAIGCGDDSGSNDAGASDGGSDSGGSDTGDSGVRDSGISDSGTSDSGMSDSGISDSGGADATLDVDASGGPAAIGDLRAGGVVFWVDPSDNTHGLVAAIEDQPRESFVDGTYRQCIASYPPPTANMGWSNDRVFVATGATGTAIGTGAANTDAIIDVQGTPNGAGEYSAWAARAYRGGGFDDWFLPSQDELNEMWLNKDAINATSVANGGVAFVDCRPLNSEGEHKDNFYWSSTENGAQYAYIQSLLVSLQHFNGKGNLAYMVRAVRSF